MTKINFIKAYQVLDSRAKPTIETIVKTKNAEGFAISPSGKSTGKHEAKEIRDKKKAWCGFGVLKEVENVNKKISKKLLGIDVSNQSLIDKTMIKLDGTKNKAKLGSNSILSVSLASARCAANSEKKELYDYLSSLTKIKKQTLPVPLLNIVNGGLHAGGNLAIQEFMLIPSGAKSFTEAMQFSVEIYFELKQTLEKKYSKKSTNVGDEGGFTPPLAYTDSVLQLLTKTIDELGLKKKVFLGIDAAANSFYNSKKKLYKIDKRQLPANELIDYYLSLIKRYPLISIEDPFQEEDFSSFADLNKKTKIKIVADDLTVTNPLRIKKAIAKKSFKTLLLKPNQIGTLTESIQAAELIKNNNLGLIVSHRSGDSEDSFISDLSIALNAEGIKSGAPARSERTSKYNRLMIIEEESNLKFIGKKFNRG